MTPEQKRYILENFKKKSQAEMARSLGMKERYVRRFLASRKTKMAISGTSAQTSHFLQLSAAPASRHLLFCLFFLAAGLVLYFNSLNASFHFDDYREVLRNPNLSDPFHPGRIWAFTKGRFFTYWTFAFDVYFSKAALQSFRLVNILIHIAVTCLVYGNCLLLLKTPGFRDHALARVSEKISLLAAFIFLCHPLQTQAVVYIVQRATLLAALFYLAALFSYLYARIYNRPLFYAAALSVSVLAFFSKENTYTLPFALILAELLCWGWKDGRLEDRILRLAPFWVLILLSYFTVRFSGGVTAPHETAVVEYSVPRLTYFLTQFKVLLTYLKLFFFPVNQTFSYDYPLSDTLWNARTFFSLAFLAGLLGCAVKLVQKNRLAAFGIFWFFLTLSIESSIFNLQDVIFEHRVYLPMFGIVIAVIAGAYYFVPKRAFWMGGLAVCIFSILTIDRNDIWKTEVTLWEDVVQKAPNRQRHQHELGYAYFQAKRYDEAITAFKKALDLLPQPPTYVALGRIYQTIEDFEQAHVYFKTAIKKYPLFPEGWYYMAGYYKQKEDWQKVIENSLIAVKLNPEFLLAYGLLGKGYQETRQFAPARKAYDKALSINPRDPNTYNMLGILAAKQTHYAEAMEFFHKALALDPQFEEARKNLDWVTHPPSDKTQPSKISLSGGNLDLNL